MCGICGFFVNQEKFSSDYDKLLFRMTAVLTHRGPDSTGHVVFEAKDTVCGLGHRRLSIIDLSKDGNQPMGNEDKTIIVVYNGEIYNYQQLRKDLQKKGHEFRSKSDTEVIVHLYEDYGDECISRLDGMFAFALLDKEKGRILLARDRMGIKPLFYSFKNGQLFFASEIKALLHIEDISREVSTKALDYFITYGYIPGSETIFKDIKKLPAASYLSFESGREEITINKFWEIKYLPKLDTNEEELCDQLITLSRSAIKRHLISDVPVGAFLSGGMDSSVVVAMMSQTNGQPINTFSLGYSDGGQDELAYASVVSKHFQTLHREFKIQPDMTQIIPELLWYLDEPFFDNSIIPTYYISKLARDRVTVALSGDGGDELFGGYEWARRHQYQNLYSAFPEFIRKIIKGAFSNGVHLRAEYGRGVLSKMRRMLHDLEADVETGFRRRTTVSHPFRQALYSDRIKSELADYDALEYQRRLFELANNKDEREKMLAVDTQSYLPDNCLFKVDRMSMAHGLEVRVPFLDRELVEFSAQIPFEYKIRGLTSKYILKKTFAPLLPNDILKQRKQGFTIPISDWLRGNLGELARSILMSKTFQRRELFNQKSIEWMLEEHNQKRQEFGHRIWSLIVFETWARLYLDEKIDTNPKVSLAEIGSNYT